MTCIELFHSSKGKPPMNVGITTSANGRYLLKDGKPWLYLAETAWRMAQRLDEAAMRHYLDDRAGRGFTAIHVHAINKEKEGPINLAAQAPFDPIDDLRKPNEAYWQHVDRMLDLVTARGLVPVVSAAWFGYHGVGWRAQVEPAAAQQYGQFLGQRYAKYPHLIWVQGGDNDPGDRTEAVRALVASIRTVAPHHLHTYHAHQEHASAVFFGDDDWLDINMGYTYKNAHQHVQNEYNRPSRVRPIVLGETGYEDEANTGFRWTPYLVRRSAYWALLGGACGYAYGSATLWHFGAGWEQALDKPGLQSVTHLGRLLHQRPWHTLVPDQQHMLVQDVNVDDDRDDRIVAASSEDGSFAVIYLPKARPFQLRVAKAPVRAHWYDPTSGVFSPIGDVPASGIQTLVPPETNAAGDSDNVLVLERG